LAEDHLAAARHNTLAYGKDTTIQAKLIANPDRPLRTIRTSTGNGENPRSARNDYVQR
jgi:hypothetical protein